MNAAVWAVIFTFFIQYNFFNKKTKKRRILYDGKKFVRLGSSALVYCGTILYNADSNKERIFTISLLIKSEDFFFFSNFGFFFFKSGTFFLVFFLLQICNTACYSWYDRTVLFIRSYHTDCHGGVRSVRHHHYTINY